MARKQYVVNYHTSGTTLPAAGNMLHGEIAVMHNPDKAELVIKDNDEELHEFIDKDAVLEIVSAATHTHDNKEILDQITAAFTTEQETKLAGISEGATKTEASTTNGEIKIDGSAVTVYTHHTQDAKEAAFVKVGNDAEGHVVLGDAIATEDLTPLLDGLYEESGAVATAIAALDKDDAAVEGKYVSAVKEENGIITVTREDLPVAAEYEIKATSASTSSVAKSYALFKDGEKVGDTIDIAKDMFVSSGGVVTVEDKKYVRLYLANSAGTYVDIDVADLAHVYTEGEAIEISDTDEISVKLASAQGEHVTVTTTDGLKVEIDLSDYATSADTVAAINAVDAKFADYATSANTVAAIKAVDDKFADYATSADTVAAIKVVDDKFADYATSADTVAAIKAVADDLAELEASAATKAELAEVDAKFADYATSANTVAAIKAVDDKFADYATSADTVAAIKAVDDKFADYATSADTVAAIKAVEDKALTGVTFNGSAATVTNNVAAIEFELPEAFIEAVEDTDSVKLTVTGTTLTADVIKVDGGEF